MRLLVCTSSHFALQLGLTTTQEKQQKQVTKKFSHVGTKLDGNVTTTLSHHPYILCHFANYVFVHMHLAYSYVNNVLSF